MTRYAFTGVARALSPEEVERVREAVRALTDGSVFVTGGAVGVDSLVAAAAAEFFPEARHLVIAPAAPWSERVPEGAELRYAAAGRTDPDSYMLRNDALVAEADVLIAFPEGAREVLRSGTWATVRRARKAGRPVRIFPLRAGNTVP